MIGEFNLFEESKKLMNCFPNSFVNHKGEFIADKFSNTFFDLTPCESRMDIKCKVLEWLSRSAYKTEPYASDKKNREFHEFMRKCINKYLGTDFSEGDMETIYTHLGNECNHPKCRWFVLNTFDMAVLGD